MTESKLGMDARGRRASLGIGPDTGLTALWLVLLLRVVSVLSVGSLLLLAAGDASARHHRSAAARKVKRDGTGDPELPDRVKLLVQEGTTALGAKDFVAATHTLSAAYRLSPTPPLLYQLGQLALAEGRIVDAQNFLRRFLHDTNEPEDSPGRKEAQRVLQLPAPPSGEVSIVGDRNVVVLIDDRIVGVVPLSLPLLLPAGEHRVVLEQGSQRLEDRISVLAGRMAELRCQFHVGVVVVTLQPALILMADYPALTGEPLQRLEKSVAQAAAGVRLGVQLRRDALVQAPKLAECAATPGCQSELANQNLVQYVLTLKAVVRPGSTAGKTADWQLHTGLLDATVGEVAAELQKECLSCTADRVVELLNAALAEVLKYGIGRPSGALAIESTPPGAEVLVGKHSLGTTPLKRPYWVGPLDLTLRHPGYRSQPASLTVAPGQTATLKLTLEAGSDIAVQRRTITRLEVLPRPRWRLGVGGAALGIGVGILGLGISALTVNSQCIPGSVIGSQCQNLYSTNGVGAGLGIGGALFLAGGVVLLALPGRRHLVTVTVDSPVAPGN